MPLLTLSNMAEETIGDLTHIKDAFRSNVQIVPCVGQTDRQIVLRINHRPARDRRPLLRSSGPRRSCRIRLRVAHRVFRNWNWLYRRLEGNRVAPDYTACCFGFERHFSVSNKPHPLPKGAGRFPSSAAALCCGALLEKFLQCFGFEGTLAIYNRYSGLACPRRDSSHEHRCLSEINSGCPIA